MAIEIERKFLLLNDHWKAAVYRQSQMIQGYLTPAENVSLRVRISDDQAWLNLKSVEWGLSRQEYEYPIPLQDAQDMLDKLLLGSLIEKTRYQVRYAGYTWEIDVFEGANKGLVVAEIELPAEDSVFEKPDWLGEEVSHDVRYFNVNLVSHPWKEWKK
ncbi:MAG: CYTH domain-containing protein [gamma proteobacterium symbiont of Bathyaustriella thionipta]|nr:CYTH domain-containing protein [gamma proteobacterium symbiont of Bathyaustriella thionipta]